MSTLSKSEVYDEHDFNGNRNRVVELAGRGYPGTYISRATGLPINLVYKLLKSEYQERIANRQQIIQAQDQTIRWLKLKITDRIHNANEKWDRRDGELLLKLMEREAKLHGLDSAVQHQVNVVIEEMSDEDVIRQLRAEGIEIKQLPPTQPSPQEEPVEDAEVVEKIAETE